MAACHQQLLLSMQLQATSNAGARAKQATIKLAKADGSPQPLLAHTVTGPLRPGAAALHIRFICAPEAGPDVDTCMPL